MTRLLMAFFALVALPASAQEITGTGQFVPILDEEGKFLWVVDTETGEVRACRLSNMGSQHEDPGIRCSFPK